MDLVGDGVRIFPPVTPSAAPGTAAPEPGQTVTFELSGCCATVTYGPAGNDTSGSVPMNVTEKLGNPVYCALTAQLQGSGSVSVKILVNGKVVSQGMATGGYDIVIAEISQDPLTGGWTGANHV